MDYNNEKMVHEENYCDIFMLKITSSFLIKLQLQFINEICTKSGLPLGIICLLYYYMQS